MAALAPADRPKAYVSAAGTDWYTDLDAQPATEATAPPPRGNPVVGTGPTPFLWTVCDEWERAALRAEPLGVRVALLRTSFVLAPGASLMGLVALPFRLWLGGPLGSGRQWFSWVHIDDVVGLYRLAIADDRVSGAVNVAAPEPCHQEASSPPRSVGRFADRAGCPSRLLRSGSRSAARRRSRSDRGASFRRGRSSWAIGSPTATWPLATAAAIGRSQHDSDVDEMNRSCVPRRTCGRRRQLGLLLARVADAGLPDRGRVRRTCGDLARSARRALGGLLVGLPSSLWLAVIGHRRPRDAPRSMLEPGQECVNRPTADVGPWSAVALGLLLLGHDQFAGRGSGVSSAGGPTSARRRPRRTAGRPGRSRPGTRRSRGRRS